MKICGDGWPWRGAARWGVAWGVVLSALLAAGCEDEPLVGEARAPGVAFTVQGVAWVPDVNLVVRGTQAGSDEVELHAPGAQSWPPPVSPVPFTLGPISVPSDGFLRVTLAPARWGLPRGEPWVDFTVWADGTSVARGVFRSFASGVSDAVYLIAADGRVWEEVSSVHDAPKDLSRLDGLAAVRPDGPDASRKPWSSLPSPQELWEGAGRRGHGEEHCVPRPLPSPGGGPSSRDARGTPGGAP